MSKERVSTTIADRWSYLWLAIGTLLGFFWTIPLVMWLAPIFTLRFMRTQKVWRGSLLLWLTSFVAFTITLRDILGAFFPLPVYVVTMAVTALLVGTLPYLADRLLWHRLPGFTATLVLPLAVTAVDFISATTSPMGSIGAQAYLQYGNLPLMQLLAITGMWGITFLVNWFGAVVNWASERSCAWPEIRRGVAIYAGIMLVVLLYGSVRVTFAPPLTGTVRVHGITEVDMRQNWGALNQLTERDGWQAMRKKTAEYRDVYLAATEREAKAGAQIVVWPEMALMVAGEDEPELIARAQKIAREHGIYLAMAVGTRYEDRRPWENKLIVLDPAGQVVLEHYKYGGAAMEGTRPGDAVLRTVETPFGTLSGIICWDTDFPSTVTQAGRNGTDILLSPSMDYRAVDPIHAHMAVYRAVENGVSVVRHADNGLSVVVDPYGRVLAAMDHFTAGEQVMVAQVPAQHVFTLYPYIGDLFAWLAIAGFVAITIWAVVRGRRDAWAESTRSDGQTVP